MLPTWVHSSFALLLLTWQTSSTTCAHSYCSRRLASYVSRLTSYVLADVFYYLLAGHTKAQELPLQSAGYRVQGTELPLQGAGAYELTRPRARLDGGGGSPPPTPTAADDAAEWPRLIHRWTFTYLLTYLHTPSLTDLLTYSVVTAHPQVDSHPNPNPHPKT